MKKYIVPSGLLFSEFQNGLPSSLLFMNITEEITNSMCSTLILISPFAFSGSSISEVYDLAAEGENPRGALISAFPASSPLIRQLYGFYPEMHSTPFRACLLPDCLHSTSNSFCTTASVSLPQQEPSCHSAAKILSCLLTVPLSLLFQGPQCFCTLSSFFPCSSLFLANTDPIFIPGSHPSLRSPETMWRRLLPLSFTDYQVLCLGKQFLVTVVSFNSVKGKLCSKPGFSHVVYPPCRIPQNNLTKW